MSAPDTDHSGHVSPCYGHKASRQPYHGPYTSRQPLTRTITSHVSPCHKPLHVMSAPGTGHYTSALVTDVTPLPVSRLARVTVVMELLWPTNETNIR